MLDDPPRHEFTRDGVFGAIIEGLEVVGTPASIITEYYTAMGKRPVKSIIRQSSYRLCHQYHLRKLAVGMESTMCPYPGAGGWDLWLIRTGRSRLVRYDRCGGKMMATTAMVLAHCRFWPDPRIVAPAVSLEMMEPALSRFSVKRIT